MKKFFLQLCVALLFVSTASAQAPGIFNYQAVARNSVGNALASKNIGVRINIHDGSATGPIVYSETRTLTTNPFGLFNVQIGSPGATNVSGTIATVNWAANTKFLEVLMDQNGGSAFVAMGTTQLASVPFALNAAGAAPTGPAGGDLLGSNFPNPTIAPLAVTTPKIADGSVTSQNITVPLIKVQADAGALIQMTNSGAGTAISGTSTGTSGAGFFQQTNATNTANNLQSNQAGLGRAGLFNATNAASTVNAVDINVAGTGFALRAASSNATPKALLTVGGLQLTGIGEAANRILVSDAAGNATWQSAAASGAVTGSGTLNFLPKWTPNGSVLGNSLLSDDGTRVITQAQVGIGTATPAASAQLDVSSTTRGFLPPRMTTAERNLIVTPATGLIIYNTTISGIQIYNGTTWYTASNAATSVPYTGATGAVNLGAYDLTVNGLTVGRGSGNIDNNTATGFQALFLNTTGAVNVANGYQALYSNTTGSNNTAIGTRALQLNTTGFYNTATGFQSLSLNTTGAANTANGNGALYSNTTGNANSATGFHSLYSNTTGAANTANGHQALLSNTTGFQNTAIGDASLLSNTTGNYNTANGHRALFSNTTGFSNTAAGIQALTLNTTGSVNVANGSQALFSNTTGSNNTANGSGALYSNTTGNANTANGYQSLRSNTTGASNTANGSGALFSNTTGFFNTATGNQALTSNTTGIQNTANGYQSLFTNTTGFFNTANGSQALLFNTTGEYNTANGHSALANNTTGTKNTAIGYAADVASNNLTNATAIGNGATVDASNKIQLGNTSVTSINTSGKLTTGLVTYPNVHGTTGQVLSTTGSGELSWITQSAGAVTSLGAIGSSSSANGATITSGVLSLAPADAINGGIVTTGAQIFAGNKVFNGNVGIGTIASTYKLDVLHGGSTGIRSQSSSSFSVVDIDGQNGDAALRFVKAGVNQWNTRNNPATDDYQIFELGGGGERMRIENTTGKVIVNGDFTAIGAKAFTMDHPLDPTNKTLMHAAIESNEVLNSYSGTVITDAGGKVTVSLPDYFEAINKDFRYQLTVMGTFAQAIVSKEVSNNKFEIATNQPNVKVSWEVKGVRNDARMRKFPFIAVQEKAAAQKGQYIDPAAYNQPESKRVSYSNVGGSSLEDVKPVAVKPAVKSIEKGSTKE